MLLLVPAGARAGRCGARHIEIGDADDDACRACAAPAPGTWCRTCRRRSGRRSPAGRRPRARAAWRGGSRDLVSLRGAVASARSHHTGAVDVTRQPHYWQTARAPRRSRSRHSLSDSARGRSTARAAPGISARRSGCRAPSGLRNPWTWQSASTRAGDSRARRSAPAGSARARDDRAGWQTHDGIAPAASLAARPWRRRSASPGGFADVDFARALRSQPAADRLSMKPAERAEALARLGGCGGSAARGRSARGASAPARRRPAPTTDDDMRQRAPRQLQRQAVWAGLITAGMASAADRAVARRLMRAPGGENEDARNTVRTDRPQQ